MFHCEDIQSRWNVTFQILQMRQSNNFIRQCKWLRYITHLVFYYMYTMISKLFICIIQKTIMFPIFASMIKTFLKECVRILSNVIFTRKHLQIWACMKVKANKRDKTRYQNHHWNIQNYLITWFTVRYLTSNICHLSPVTTIWCGNMELAD